MHSYIAINNKFLNYFKIYLYAINPNVCKLIDMAFYQIKFFDRCYITIFYRA